LRALAFLSTVPFSILATVLVFASCDTGGEPATFDAGGEAGFGDVTPTDSRSQDQSIVDTIDDTADASCGLLGNACCVTEAGTTCSEGKCTDVAGTPPTKLCEPANCGKLGHVCCVGPESPCADGQVCHETDGGGVCGPCGASGDPCCSLNTCNSGGCCLGGHCTMEGNVCSGTDAAVCSSGACGSCGGPGSPCCSLGCTAPGTVCQGSVEGTDGGEGGGGTSGSSGLCVSCGGCGEACCSGTPSCRDSLSCVSGFCAALGDASCPAEGDP
jgi:hypothetical protein